MEFKQNFVMTGDNAFLRYYRLFNNKATARYGFPLFKSFNLLEICFVPVEKVINLVYSVPELFMSFCHSVDF